MYKVTSVSKCHEQELEVSSRNSRRAKQNRSSLADVGSKRFQTTKRLQVCKFADQKYPKILHKETPLHQTEVY